MKKKQYLLRLDDACPTMDRAKWGQIELILDRYGVKPMVGVIPHNEDPMQQIDSEEEDFWADSGTLKRWLGKGWSIALHGYNHCYTSECGLQGLNPICSRSEFAGLPLAEQQEKIKKGINIMRNAGINLKYFFAPSHTFDENTLSALRSESDIRIVSDTIATHPYRHGDFIFIPQFGGSCRVMPFNGIFTFCLHPSTMKEGNFTVVENFLKEHHKEVITFDDIDLTNVGVKSLFSKLLSWAYFMRRRLNEKD